MARAGIWVSIFLFCVFHSFTKGDKTSHLTDKPDRLHVFIQITDIHISQYQDPGRATDLQVFCTKNIDVIKPEVVIATGDLTHAIFSDTRFSRQYEAEWLLYKNVLETTRVLDKTTWLDIRGNHDAFNVASSDDPASLYRRYSALQQSDRVLHHRHLSRGDTISFLAVDMCPDPSPRRPFNFFGILTEEIAAEVKAKEVESRDSEARVWFGHYPTSTVYNPQPLRAVLGLTEDVYMCGHLHTLGGLMPAMYTRHPGGNLELEAADWKDNRMYRVFAFDHGMLAFSDQRFDQWPVVLVTNPPHAHYAHHKHVVQVRNSTHIRLLVYHVSEVEYIRVTLDDAYLGQGRRYGDDSALYVVPWQPARYATGTHTITVTVVTESGGRTVVTHPFRLDAGPNPSDGYPGDTFRYYLLTSDFATVAKLGFLIGWMGFTVSVAFIKILTHTANVCQPRYGCGFTRWFYRWFYRLQLLTLTPCAFYPLMLYHCYLAVGPWFFGEIIDGYYGVCGVWGIYVKGAWIPGTLTYAYATMQLLLYTVPLTLYLSYYAHLSVTHRGYHATSSRGHDNSDHVVSNAMLWVQRHGLFCIFVAMHGYYGFLSFYQPYGVMAAATCPIRTYNVVLALVLRHWVLHLDPGVIRVQLKVNNGKIEHSQ